MGELRRGEAAKGNTGVGGSFGPTAAAAAMGMAGPMFPGQPYAEGKINAWLRGFGGAGEKDGHDTHIGYDWAGGGGALGVDFLVNDGLLLGLMGGYSQSKVDYDNVGGSSDIGLAWGGVYATYFTKNWYVDGLFGYGRNFFDSKRKFSIGAFDANVNSDPEGNNYTAAVDTGYNFQLGRGWGIEPNLRLSWARVDVDGFSESTGGGAGLKIHSITQDSLQSELGVQVSKIFRSGREAVWMPELRVGWVHEYLDDDRRITASFANSPGSMKLHGDDPGKDGATVRAGMTVFINKMVSVYGFYNGDFKGDRMYNGGTAGVRLRF
jgi:subtilase-type serine protease